MSAEGAIQRRNGVLSVGPIALPELAERFGTPSYVYSADEIRARYELLRRAFGPRVAGIHYSVKALSTLSILQLLDRLGAGFDVVSGGEIARCRAIGIDGAKLVFAGVGKTQDELEFAVAEGVGVFNVESADEFHRLGAVARAAGRELDVALRVNPDVDARTHPYITTGREHNKFGMDPRTAWQLLDAGEAGLRFLGFHLHIGSQITETEPLVELASVAVDMAREAALRGHPVRMMNLGGGLGVAYGGGGGLDLEAAVRAMDPLLERLGAPVLLEPGRFLVAEAGLLLTRVVLTKGRTRRFVVVDAGMNDLLRPALYQAKHQVDPVVEREGEPTPVDVVGPICESADFFALGHSMPPVESGDLLAVRTAGAYGASMANQYNSRPRAAEVLVDGDQVHLIRRRETPEDLWRAEWPGAFPS